METKLIRLKDGTLVEVSVEDGRAQKIASRLADEVGSSAEVIKPVLMRICAPIVDVWTEINKQTHIEQAEVELGLSFEGEGNLYITKAKATANITVKLVLKS